MHTFYPSDVESTSIKCKRSNPLKNNTVVKDKSGTVFQSSCSIQENTIASNGLVSLLTQAYCYHHKIVLRPEDIWMAILTQFACYTNRYSEDLRDVFVSHQDKKNLVVKDTECFSKDLSVMSVKMVEKMKEYLKDTSLSEWILPKFSTTTYKDTCIFSMVMMGTLKNYFSYRFELSCGLPEVTLLGTVDDWKDIKNRALQLTKYNLANKNYMKKWLELLTPVLDNFIKSAQGNPDLEWWNKVCHRYAGGSGPSFLSGWVTVFNVFSNEGVWLADNRSNNHRDVVNSEYPLINTNDISYGFVSFDVVVVDADGREFQAEMYTGCMRADIKDEDTIVPRLDYGVVEYSTEQ